MASPAPMDQYAQLLGLRGKYAKAVGLMPYAVLSDACIRDLLKIKPKNLGELKTIASVTAEVQKALGNEIIGIFEIEASNEVQPAEAPAKEVEKAKKTTVITPRMKKRPAGGLLAEEEDDVRILPQSAPVDQNSPAKLYERYQMEMKSVDSLGSNADHTQNSLLDWFCAGYPLQLSRLGIASSKEVYNAIPNLLSLRGGVSTLEVADLQDSSVLSVALLQLFPALSTTQIRLALCEWYHDLNPELQLNSAKYKKPSPTFNPRENASSTSQNSNQRGGHSSKKRKSPTEAEEDDIIQLDAKARSAPLNVPRTLDNPSQITSNASSRNLTVNEAGTRPGMHLSSGATAVSSFPSTPQSLGLRRSPRDLSKTAITGSLRERAKMTAAMREGLNEELLDDDSHEKMDEDDESKDVEREKHDSAYEAKPPRTKFTTSCRPISWSASKVSSSSASHSKKVSSDSWRHEGPRPKKQPKRSSMDSIGFISFAQNTIKERTSLTDDDFAGTEAAYFADVYAPGTETAKPPVAAPTVTSSAPNSKPEPISQEIGMDSEMNALPLEMEKSAANPVMSPSSSDSSSSKEVSVEPASKAAANLVAIPAPDLLQLFARIRSMAGQPQENANQKNEMAT